MDIGQVSVGVVFDGYFTTIQSPLCQTNPCVRAKEAAGWRMARVFSQWQELSLP